MFFYVVKEYLKFYFFWLKIKKNIINNLCFVFSTKKFFSLKNDLSTFHIFNSICKSGIDSGMFQITEFFLFLKFIRCQDYNLRN